ncbi:hypothetical protein [Streptomyces sp. NPDC088801]
MPTAGGDEGQGGNCSLKSGSSDRVAVSSQTSSVAANGVSA